MVITVPIIGGPTSLPEQWFVGTLTLPMVSRTSHGEAQEYITSNLHYYGLKNIPWRGSGVHKNINLSP